MALEEAFVHCSEQSKSMFVLLMAEREGSAFEGKSVDLMFTCQ